MGVPKGARPGRHGERLFHRGALQRLLLWCLRDVLFKFVLRGLVLQLECNDCSAILCCILWESPSTSISTSNSTAALAASQPAAALAAAANALASAALAAAALASAALAATALSTAARPLQPTVFTAITPKSTAAATLAAAPHAAAALAAAALASAARATQIAL